MLREMVIKECDWLKREENGKREGNGENDKKRAAHIFIYIYIYTYKDNEESLGRFGFRST